MAGGSYTAWDCLNQHYGVERSERGAAFMVLYFRGVYNLAQLAQLYAMLPDVASAEPNGSAGDGSSIFGTPEGTDWHYVIDRASGDCPAGCITHELYHF